MENRRYVSTEYKSGHCQIDGRACREDDDYWIFWSKKRFLRYFVDGVKEPDEKMEDDKSVKYLCR